jgi:cytochrome c peroxidase
VPRRLPGKRGTGPGEPPDIPFNPETLQVEVQGFPAQQIPPDNPTTRQGVELGRRLFHDPILSGDDTQSCASCHSQAFSFTDNGRRFSQGIDGIEGTRNAPALINVGWIRSFFWDGRAASLEDQALQPVPNPIEMHEEWPDVVTDLEGDPTYPDLFAAAFGDPAITRERVVKAIAQFERTFVSNDSKYDRFLRGEVELTPQEDRGFRIFFTERGDCFHCHGNILLTDNVFHNTGLDSEFTADPGLFAVTHQPSDLGLFKTPTLRNVEYTAPYMHDGRFNTLEEVVQHYNRGTVYSPTVDPLMRPSTGLGLSDDEVADLVAFLSTFSDPAYLTNPDYGP